MSVTFRMETGASVRLRPSDRQTNTELLFEPRYLTVIETKFDDENLLNGNITLALLESKPRHTDLSSLSTLTINQYRTYQDQGWPFEMGNTGLIVWVHLRGWEETTALVELDASPAVQFDFTPAGTS